MKMNDEIVGECVLVVLCVECGEDVVFEGVL